MILLALALAVAEQEPSRWALVVGDNAGIEDEAQLRYAETDALKIARVLTDLGGFEASHIDVELGVNADALRAALVALKSRVQSASEKQVIFFYYSGHADASALHLSGTKLATSELTETLATLGARVSITLVDACKSGALTRAKGAVPGPAYDVSLAESVDVAGRIVISSSSDEEIAQESDRLQGSFFTHYWVTGLYGAADSNNDGLVTLEEAYRFAHYRTIERTIESRGGVQHPAFNFSLSGQGNIIFANLSRASALLVVPAGEYDSPYFVLDAQRQIVLMEMQPMSGRVAAVHLPPGRYEVRKREPGRILSATVTLAAQQSVVLSDRDMSVAAYEGPSAKGVTRVDISHGPEVSFGVRNGLVRGMSAAPELSIGYELGFGPFFFEPRFIWRTSTYLSAPGTGFHYQEYDFGFSFGLHQAWRDFVFGGGIDAGLVDFDEHYFAPPFPAYAGPIIITNGTTPPPEPSPVKGNLPLAFEGGGIGKVRYRLPAFRWGAVYVSAYLRLAAAVFAFDGAGRTAFIASGGGGLVLLFR